MPKKVIIVHGWGGSPQEPMLAWMKKELEKKDFEVIVPKMPNPEKPKISPWTDKIKEVLLNPNKDTFLIGHSIGCLTILKYLENLPKETKVGGIVFIAPWTKLDNKTIEEEGQEAVDIMNHWIERPINWEKIKKMSDDIICLFSDNDLYVPLSNKDFFKEKLKAKCIIEHNKGHYDPDSNIKENLTAVDEILNITRK